MTAQELLRHQLDDSAYQVDKVFEGLAESDADSKVAEDAMTPRETLVHLCECLVAFDKHCDGAEHSWGTYDVADKSLANLTQTFRSLRQAAADRATNTDDPQTHKYAMAYIAMHEPYHVGQMATFRLNKTEGWDPYSIYRGE